LIGKAVKKVSTGPDLFGDAAHARLDFAAKLAKWTAAKCWPLPALERRV
jgi:hypothetical protein